MAYSKEELNEAYEKLPPELKEAMLSVDTVEAINSIGKKYRLHVDQIGDVGSETGYVLLGLTHPTDFVGSLTKRLGIDRILASQIASDINDQIFLQVREQLKTESKKTTEEEPGPENSEDPHPTKEALLEVIQNPEGMKKRPVTTKNEIPLVAIPNPYTPAKPQIGKDFPVVASVPTPAPQVESKAEAPAGDILTQKMSGQFSMPKVETTVEASSKKADPYREAV